MAFKRSAVRSRLSPPRQTTKPRLCGFVLSYLINVDRDGSHWGLTSSLASYGRDCRNNPISNLEWVRVGVGMSLKELSEKSGVSYVTIAKVEGGTAQAGNLTARNLLALSDALGVDPHDLI